MPRPLSWRVTAGASVLLSLVLALTGCSSGSSQARQQTPHQVLATAKRHLDRAQSVHLVLSTSATPQTGSAVLGADGVLTHQPAFRGKVKVLLGGFTADVPVVAVGGTVHARLPLTTHYAVIDPSEYGAPDPAAFADPSHGLSGLLLQVQRPHETGRKRDGEQVLTTYTGTLPGDRVQQVIPSADPDTPYRTVVGIDDRGRVVTVTITGHFFSASQQATYDLAFDSYGRRVHVTAP